MTEETKVATNADVLRSAADLIEELGKPYCLPSDRLRALAEVLDRITLVEIQALRSVEQMDPATLPGYGVPIHTAANILDALWVTP